MLRLLVSGLLASFAISQNPIPSCCDPTIPACQDTIRNCIITGSPDVNCQALACATALPSPTCCDGGTQKCQDSIKLCIGAGGTIDACSRLACPSYMPSVPPCCDGTLQLCQDSIKLCIGAGGTLDVCARLSCPSTKPTQRIDPSATATAKQTDPSATATTKQTDVSVSATAKQTDVSASVTAKQADVSATATAKQTDVSASVTAKQTDVSVSATAKQTDASATASTTAKQTDASVTASTTAKQTDTSVIPKQTGSSYPSTRSTQRPIPSAYPTMFIKPLFSPMRSKIPIRSHLPTNYIIPERISALLTFPKGNITILRKPEKLQEIQAKIACALRLSLEQIELRNISIARITGKLEVLDIDLSMARLISNGLSSCMILTDNVVDQPTLRRQLMATDSIVVSYDIINPPEEIILADTNAALIADGNLLAFANSIGSPNVIPGIEPQVPAASSPSPSPSSIVGVIVGATFGGIAVVGVAFAVSYYVVKRRQRPHAIIRSVQSSDVLWSNANGNPLDTSRRVIYIPGQIRI